MKTPKGDPFQVADITHATTAGPWGKVAHAARLAPRDDGIAPAGVHLFADVARVFYVSMPTRDENSRRSILAMWAEVFRDRYIDDITAADVGAALDQLAQMPVIKYAGLDRVTGEKVYREHGRRAAATINRYRSVLSSLLDFARRKPKDFPTHLRWQRYLSTAHPNAAKEIPALELPAPRDRTVAAGDVETLLAYARAAIWPRMYLFTLMLLTTGARRSEILLLRGDQLHLRGEQPTATLQRTKNDEPRTLVLTPTVVAEIRRLGEPRGSEFLFPAVQARSAGKPYSIGAAFKRLLLRAGLTTARLHDLRHTVGGRLADEGRNPLEIAALLGHKDLRSTKRYSFRNVKATAAMVNETSLGRMR